MRPTAVMRPPTSHMRAERFTRGEEGDDVSRATGSPNLALR